MDEPPKIDLAAVNLEEVDSVVLRRLIEEVRQEQLDPPTPTGYNRIYNRYMPSTGPYNRTYNRHNR